jgi:hypothetical protein
MLLASIAMLRSQEKVHKVSRGDILTVGSPSGSTYQHIDFPRKNIIIKRGAIADFNNLLEIKVIVEHMAANKDGSTEVVLKRKDGHNFFRFYPFITANLDKALEKAELKVLVKKAQ